MKLRQKPTQAEIAAKVAAHAEAARAKKKQEAEQEIRTLGAIEAEGLTIQHFRPTVVIEGAAYALQVQTGGITVAYRQQSKNSFVEVATALCHRDDGFNRKRGTQVAVEQFLSGHVIRVPSFYESPQEVIEFLFRDYFTFDPDQITR